MTNVYASAILYSSFFVYGVHVCHSLTIIDVN